MHGTLARLTIAASLVAVACGAASELGPRSSARGSASPAPSGGSGKAASGGADPVTESAAALADGGADAAPTYAPLANAVGPAVAAPSVAAFVVTAASGVGEGHSLEARIGRDGCIRAHSRGGTGRGHVQESTEYEGCVSNETAARWFDAVRSAISGASGHGTDGPANPLSNGPCTSSATSARPVAGHAVTIVAADGSFWAPDDPCVRSRLASIADETSMMLYGNDIPSAAPTAARGVRTIEVTAEHAPSGRRFRGRITTSGAFRCERTSAGGKPPGVHTRVVLGAIPPAAARAVVDRIIANVKLTDESAFWTHTSGAATLVAVDDGSPAPRGTAAATTAVVERWRSATASLSAVCTALP